MGARFLAENSDNKYLQVPINPGSESVLIDDVLIIKRVGTLKAIET